MKCVSCQRLNLPGGRCLYCGTPLPAGLEFDFASAGGAVASPPAVSADSPGSAEIARESQAGRSAGLIGFLAFLLLKGKTLLALLKFGKLLTTFGSMGIFVVYAAQRFGWKLGLGFTLSIFVHEMGHVVVNWRKGLKQSAPMFIPFVGAVIFVKQFPDDPTIQSESGAGGPFAGMLFGLGCLLCAFLTGDPFWYYLTALVMMVNLFNLLPFPPLDGSHIATVFSPALWSGLLIALLLCVLKFPSAWIWGLLIFNFVFRLTHHERDRHLLAVPRVRVRMAAIYFLLSVVMAYSAEFAMERGHVYRERATQAPVSPSRPASQPNTPQVASASSVRKRSALTPARRQRIARGLQTVLVILSLILWPMTFLLLSAAAAAPFEARRLVPALALTALLPLLYTTAIGMQASLTDRWLLVESGWAAGGAALFYAAFQAILLRGRSYRPDQTALTARCLAWGAGGALLVAYTANSLLIAGIIGLLLLGFYARSRWMWFSMIGGIAQKLGDLGQAQAWRQRALTLHPDTAGEAALQTHITLTALHLQQGQAAFHALEARDRLPEPFPSPIQRLQQRLAALILLGQYDQVLACCEQILQASPDDPRFGARLLIAHRALASLAQHRGWYDEAEAQSTWCLQAISQKAHALRAEFYLKRAEARMALGQQEAAEKDVAEAVRLSAQPEVITEAALLRGSLALAAGRLAEADRETEHALRSSPASLKRRYWRGRVLLANGKREAGESILRELAASFAHEYWGQQAIRCLQASA